MEEFFKFGAPIKIGEVEFECPISGNPEIKNGYNFYISGLDFIHSTGIIVDVQTSSSGTYRAKAEIYL